MILGKLYGDWHFISSNEEKGRQLRSFLERHGDCCIGLKEDTLGGMSACDPNFEPFELVYENRDDWGHMQTLQEKDKELHPELYNN